MAFGAGDVIAVLGLVERIATEIHHFRDAPQQFRQLEVELQLVRRTLQRVLDIETEDAQENEHLDGIRAIAIHCQQPLLKFIAKMRPSEASLGNFRSAGTVSALGRRLHWSLITRNDIDDLRKILLSEMMAINVLLGVQQLNYLKRHTPLTTETEQFRNASSQFFTEAMSTIKDCKIVSEQNRAASQLLLSRFSNQNEVLCDTHTKVQHLNTTSDQLLKTGTSALVHLKSLHKRVSSSVSALLSTLSDVRHLLAILVRLSKSVLGKISKNAHILLVIHSNIKKLSRMVEAIPLHLGLDIVRLDDALGESWALPFQACTEWQSFTDLLKSVVFPHSRQGSSLVESGQYRILNVDGRQIDPVKWKTLIKSGSHITQAMVLRREINDFEICPHCHTQRKGSPADLVPCSNCGKSSSYGVAVPDQFKFQEMDQQPSAPMYGESERIREPSASTKFDLNKLPQITTTEYDASSFRHIHIQENTDVISSLHIAEKILSRDSQNGKAMQYIGWWNLVYQRNLEQAIDWLEKSINCDASNAETWYILGRVYMSSNDFLKSYNAFRQAVYRDSRTPTFWISIGNLYFIKGQYRDALDAYTRALRLNPKVGYYWQNLGILYDHVNQPDDAFEAYYQAWELLGKELDHRFIARISKLALKMGYELGSAADIKFSNGLRLAQVKQSVMEEAAQPFGIQHLADFDLTMNIENMPREVEHKQKISFAPLHYTGIDTPVVDHNDHDDSESDWADADSEDD